LRIDRGRKALEGRELSKAEKHLKTQGRSRENISRSRKMFIQVKGPPIYTVYRRFPLHWSIHMLPYHFPGSPHGPHVFSRGLHMVLMSFPGVSTWFSCLFPGSPHVTTLSVPSSHACSHGLHMLPLCRFLPPLAVVFPN